jgi:uncharacterized protein (DUF1499 family)
MINLEMHHQPPLNRGLIFLLCFITALLAGCDVIKPIPFAFDTLQRSDKPNSYLICPKNYCTTTLDDTAPIFDVNIADLQAAWGKMIAAQPRIELLEMSSDHLTYQYVQRSFLLHFPDIINVKLIPINNHQSTLAIYSTAVYGYYDFHVNKNRVQNWLTALRNAINYQ